MGHMMNMEGVVNDNVRGRLGPLQVTVVELEMQALVAGKIIMNQRGIFMPAILGRKNTRKITVFDLDQAQSLVCDILSVGGNGGDFIMLTPDLVLERHIVTDEAKLQALGILPVRTQCTPGRFSASAVSMLTISAWARPAWRIFPISM